jgi:hypothetical protein
VKQCLLAGEIPLWNPLNDCGLPFVAQWNTMVFYPPALLNLLLPLSWSVGLLAVLHLYLGGLGMYALALKWTRHTHGAAFAGVSYAFSGIMQTSLMWPNNIAALGLLPWVLVTLNLAWGKGGRSILVAGAVGALQMLSGAPEIVLFTWVLAGLILLVDLAQQGFRRAGIFRFACCVFLTAGLSAIQLVPFLDLFVHSPRASGDVYMDWAIGRAGWANFFIPLFENTGPQGSGVFYQVSQKWTHSYYCGVAPWLLLICAVAGNRSWRVRLLACLVPFAILLAMGKDGGLYPVVNKVLPLGAMRFPVKFLMLVMVCLPLLGAYAMRRLPVMRRSGGWVWSMMAAIGLFVIALSLSGGREMTEAARSLAAGNAKGRLLMMMILGALLVFGVRGRGGFRRRIWMTLVFFVWVDLTTHQPNLAPTISRSVYAEKNIAKTSLADARMGAGRALPSDAAQNYFLSGPSKPLTEHFREKRAGLYSDMNLLDDVAKVNGFYSLWLPRFGEVQHLLYDGPHGLRQGFADFLGIRHVTSSRSPVEWLTRNTARPLVTAGQAPVVMSFAEIQTALPTPQFNPTENVLLETSIAGPVRDRSAAVTNLQWSAHRIRFRVNAAAPTMASIAQSHYHCWRATLNGAPVPIHLANGAFQAVAVPAGESEIVMEYVDRGFQIGVLLSGLSALIALGFWWRLRA